MPGLDPGIQSSGAADGGLYWFDHRSINAESDVDF
jgi:hypothetical protein